MACEALRRPSRRTTRERTRARGFLDPKEEANHTTAESSLLSVGVMLHFTHFIFHVHVSEFWWLALFLRDPLPTGGAHGSRAVKRDHGTLSMGARPAGGWLHAWPGNDSSLRTSGSQPASPSRSNELTVASYL